MKKIISIITLILHLSIISFAQTLSVGVNYGYNLSQLTGDYRIQEPRDFIKNNPISNYTYGVVVNYHFKSKLSLQGEINYKTKSHDFRMADGVMGGGIVGRVDFNYLEIPLLMKYSFGNRLKLFVNTGPSVNILLSGGNYYDITFSDNPPFQDQYHSLNILSDFNTITIGIVGGIGISYNVISNINLHAQIRTSYDLTNAAKVASYSDPNRGGTWSYNTTHFLDYVMQFGLSYTFY